MQLKHFVITILLVYVFVVCGGFLLYRTSVVYPQLVDQTLLRHQLDFRAIESALVSEQKNLSLLVYDWAKWDDLYKYIEDHNTEFERSNIAGSILGDLNLNGIYFFQNKENLYLGIEEEKMGMRAAGLSELVSGREIIFKNFRWPNNIQLNHKYHYQPVLDQLTLFYASTIQDSNEAKEARGYLVFSRAIDLTEIRLATGADFELHNPSKFSSKLLPISETIRIKELASQYTLGFYNKSQDSMDFVVEVHYPESKLPVMIDYQTLVVILVLILIPMIIIYVISRVILNPLSNMSQFILTLKTEIEPDKLPHYGFIREVKVFGSALTELMTHVKNERLMLEQQSMTDALTGVKNRRAFDEEVFEFWRAAPRINKPILIVMIDIDFFKIFNDTYGHQQGDDAIKAIALALKSVCRRSSDQVYRYGGEEFCITMTLEHAEDVDVILESFHRAVSNLLFPHSSSPISKFLTVSVGACLVTHPGDWMKDYTFKKGVESADKALYKTKRAGKNTYTLHVLATDGVDVLVKKNTIALTSESKFKRE